MKISNLAGLRTIVQVSDVYGLEGLPIPEIPEGFELVDFRMPVVGDRWITLQGTVITQDSKITVKQNGPRIIVRPRARRYVVEFCAAPDAYYAGGTVFYGKDVKVIEEVKR